ncbi:MAG: hypothetical protein ACRECN_06760 [Methylocella sp.]
MRFNLTVVFVAALVAVPAQSKAAPRGIDDCEKIQAADAYNQCLAVFGPVARGHGTAGEGLRADRQDTEAGTANAHAEMAMAGDLRRGRSHASRHSWARHSWAGHGRARHGWARHSWARHSWAGHGHWHRTGHAGHRHGRTTNVAFSVVSGNTRLR